MKISRKYKVASLSAGLALAALPFGGWVAAALAAGAGYIIGDTQFSKDKKPWRDLHELLHEGEHNRLEFKESLSRGENGKFRFDGIIRSVIGFANTDGGEILLGVSDNGRITGINNLIDQYKKRDKFELALREVLRSNIDAPVDKMYRIKFEMVDKRVILRVDVEKVGYQVFTKQKGECYIREGNQTRALTPKEVSDRRDKMVGPYNH